MKVSLIKNVSYNFCLSLWIIVSVLFGRTTLLSSFGLTTVDIYSIGRMAVYFLLLFVIFGSGIGKKECSFFLIVTPFLLLSALQSGETVLLGVMLFIIAAKKVSAKEILNVYFKTHLALTVLTMVLSFFKIIDPNIVDRGLIQRYSFGFSHPNVFGSEVLTITFCYIALYWYKIRLREIIAIELFSIILLKQADSRMAMVVITLLLAGTFLYRVIFKEGTHLLLLRNTILIAFFSLVLFTIFIIFFYKTDNALLISFDKLLSFRFTAMRSMYLKQGIHLFGKALVGDDSITVDNSYARILLVNGVVPFIIICVFNVIICIQYYKHKDTRMLLVLFAVVMSGFIENSFFRIENNFCLVIGGAYLLSVYHRRREEISFANRKRQKEDTTCRFLVK